MQTDLLISEDIVDRIVEAVIQRIKEEFLRALIVVPRFRSELAEAFARLVHDEACGRIFDLAVPAELPQAYLNELGRYGMKVDKQFIEPDALDMRSYDRVFVLDLHPALIREVSSIRPYTFAGSVIIDAMEAQKTVKVITSSFSETFEETRGSMFLKDLHADLQRLKAWGLVFDQGHGSEVHISGRLITASKLAGYENCRVSLESGAILTVMAREKASRDGITIVE